MRCVSIRDLNKRCKILNTFVHVHRPCHKCGYSARAPELDSAYLPKNVESDGQNDADYFKIPVKSSKPFSLLLPPPNITGTLHLGHALTATIQDVLVRWKKMRGVETMWVPGMDHAGIATQVVVEKKLWKEKGLTRHDIGREKFVEEVWKWKRKKGDVIAQQLRRLGVCLDWQREMFTMDAGQSRAVTEAFVKMYEKGLIYRSDYLVNWSCALQSAISDIEVEYLEVDGPSNIAVTGYEKPVQFGVLTKFAYKLHESDGEIVVATTRPETMFGDAAVAVNPKDDRYSRLVGRNLWHPFRKKTIPIIADDFVDPQFGTGAVKVTPGHDPTDFEVGQRHRLSLHQIVDERGHLTSICGEYAGTPRFKAREVVLERLQQMDLLRGTQPHPMSIPVCSRSKDVVEFLVKPQWFVKCKEMAQKAAEDVGKGDLEIVPKHFEKTWFSWLDNIRDWCVSRQLWWGHRIPAYECFDPSNEAEKCWIVARNEEEARKLAKKKFANAPAADIQVKQDEDVLDTWFSSALLPFSAFGWPDKSEDFQRYYPLSMMETGHDILFFWVARMVMLGRELTQQLPFPKIVLHGIICDAHGRKMSKSLGNVVAPEDVINGINLKEMEQKLVESHEAGLLSKPELQKALTGQKKMFPEGIPECGADALRFTLCSHSIKNHFINFDVRECHTNRLFCNKIWQAAKFVVLWTDKWGVENDLHLEEEAKLLPMDRWILSRLSAMVETVDEAIGKYDFHVATGALKDFLYYDFCDVYLETTKRGLRSLEGKVATYHCQTLLQCLDVGLRALAPFMPRLCQHIHHRLPGRLDNVGDLSFPESLPYRDVELEKKVEKVMEVVVAIRRLKKIFGITARHKPEVILTSTDQVYQEFLNPIQDLSNCFSLNITSSHSITPPDNFVSDDVGGTVKLFLRIPDEVKSSFSADLPKLEQRKQKLLVELEKIKEMTESPKSGVAMRQVDAKKMTLLEEKVARINYIQSFCKTS